MPPDTISTLMQEVVSIVSASSGNIVIFLPSGDTPLHHWSWHHTLAAGLSLSFGKAARTIFTKRSGDRVSASLTGMSSSCSSSAVIRVGGIEILLVTIPRQILDLQQFRAFGIDPQSKHVVALKSMHHFHAAFEPIAGHIIVCGSGALCTPRYDRLPYRNVPRPILPLDPQAG